MLGAPEGHRSSPNSHSALGTLTSLILKQTGLDPASEALHWLFPLPGMLFPNIFTWFNPSSLSH